MNFEIWLSKNSELSESSIYKYSHAVITVSNEMLNERIIEKPLTNMELYEIDLAIPLIFGSAIFMQKNVTGNHMYSNALKWYRCFVEATVVDGEVVQQNVNIILNDHSIEKTERVAIVKSRIGQGIFRERLFAKYGKCIITGLSIPQVLVASHIKPWSVSSNTERLDENNGLLLSATYDRLFDSGLISFLSSGKILISRSINKDNADKLALSSKSFYDLKVGSKMEEFLQYHNDVIFLK